MSGRPASLFPLFAALTTLPGIGPKTAAGLERAGVTRPRDLLFLLPQSGIDRRPTATVQGVPAGHTVTVAVTVAEHRPGRRKGQPHRVMVDDAAIRFALVWFNARGERLRELLPEGARRVVSGRIELFDGLAQMVHPDHVVPLERAEAIPAFEPVYPAAGGTPGRIVARAAAAALDRAPDLAEWIDGPLRSRRGWPDWRAAIAIAHMPAGQGDLAPTAPSRERLAYDELFAHQLTLALARQRRRRAPGLATDGDGRLRQAVLKALPYAPTGAQRRAAGEIAADMAAPARMYRLLQGDVGAGKTLVAVLALLIAVEAGGQGALMAPTEILARQHFTALQPLLAPAGATAALLTGRDTGAARAGKLADLAAGRTDILVGTHAVFGREVDFADLRLAVIDEQHRFGVEQRMELARKGRAVDVLVMTATPIPRSLALTQYGDVELSVLDEKPPGRTPIRTALASAARMDEVVGHLREAVAAGRRAYWVCPKVSASQDGTRAAAEERHRHLAAALGPDMVALVHGQMPAAEKDRQMARFLTGAAPVLVATTVIEVGVDVPEATIMVIEQAESYGLAQLHQLRGRVGRGAAASTCLLLYEPPLSEAGMARLKLLRDTEDGFRIAEADLEMRGTGDLIGTAQAGLPRFAIADAERQAGLLTVARDDARALLDRDPDLTSDRGWAARVLLWLLEQDRALRLMSVG